MSQRQQQNSPELQKYLSELREKLDRERFEWQRRVLTTRYGTYRFTIPEEHLRFMR